MFAFLFYVWCWCWCCFLLSNFSTEWTDKKRKQSQNKISRLNYGLKSLHNFCFCFSFYLLNKLSFSLACIYSWMFICSHHMLTLIIFWFLFSRLLCALCFFCSFKVHLEKSLFGFYYYDFIGSGSCWTRWRIKKTTQPANLLSASVFLLTHSDCIYQLWLRV